MTIRVPKYVLPLLTLAVFLAVSCPAAAENAAPLSEEERLRQQQIILEKSYRAEKLTQKKREEVRRKIKQIKRYPKTPNPAKEAKIRYKDVMALYKAKRYTEAKDDLRTFRRFLIKSQLTTEQRTEWILKADEAEGKIQAAEERMRSAFKRSEDTQRREKEFRESKNKQEAVKTAKKADVKEPTKPSSEKRSLWSRLPLVGGSSKEKSAVQAPAPQAAPLKKPAAVSRLSLKPDAAQPAAPRVDPQLEAEKITLVREQRQIDDEAAVRKQEIARQREGLKKEFLVQVDALYDDGVQLYQVGSYEIARDIMVQIDKMMPNYKQCRHYLSLIQDRMSAEEERSATSVAGSAARGQSERIEQ